MTLGEAIKSYRTVNNLSQREFAIKCGTSNGYISMLERGKNAHTGEPIMPTIGTFKLIAKGMGMNLQMLFSLVDDMPVNLSDDVDAFPDDEVISDDRRALIEAINEMSEADVSRVLKMIDLLNIR